MAGKRLMNVNSQEMADKIASYMNNALAHYYKNYREFIDIFVYEKDGKPLFNFGFDNERETIVGLGTRHNARLSSEESDLFLEVLRELYTIEPKYKGYSLDGQSEHALTITTELQSKYSELLKNIL